MKEALQQSDLKSVKKYYKGQIKELTKTIKCQTKEISNLEKKLKAALKRKKTEVIQREIKVKKTKVKGSANISNLAVNQTDGEESKSGIDEIGNSNDGADMGR